MFMIWHQRAYDTPLVELPKEPSPGEHQPHVYGSNSPTAQMLVMGAEFPTSHPILASAAEAGIISRHPHLRHEWVFSALKEQHRTSHHGTRVLVMRPADTDVLDYFTGDWRGSEDAGHVWLEDTYRESEEWVLVPTEGSIPAGLRECLYLKMVAPERWASLRALCGCPRNGSVFGIGEVARRLYQPYLYPTVAELALPVDYLQSFLMDCTTSLAAEMLGRVGSIGASPFNEPDGVRVVEEENGSPRSPTRTVVNYGVA